MTPSDSRSGLELPVSDAATLGAAIRTARKAHGLTQSQLAGLAGTGLRLISELERGKPGAELGKVLDVLAVLGLRMLVVEAGQ